MKAEPRSAGFQFCFIAGFDSASGFEAGPFVTGDRLFLRIVPTQRPMRKTLPGYAARLQFQGPALVIAVDDTSNDSEPASCQPPVASFAER